MTAIHVKPKVFRYQTKVRWVGERKGVCSALDKPDIQVATPPEFKGHPGMWSPEDFYVSAANNCFMSTFVGMSARYQLNLVAFSSEAEGTLESVEGFLQFTKIVLNVQVKVNSQEQVDLAKQILVKAKEDCLVARSVKHPVELGSVQVEVEG